MEKENYQNFKNNEIAAIIFVSNNLNDNFSNVHVVSEYPVENNRNYTLDETPGKKNHQLLIWILIHIKVIKQKKIRKKKNLKKK